LTREQLLSDGVAVRKAYLSAIVDVVAVSSCACRKSNPDIFVMQALTIGLQKIRPALFESALPLMGVLGGDIVVPVLPANIQVAVYFEYIRPTAMRRIS
jgi:hypothetical protein